ncbi:MAG TPA: S8 family serine peptidase, partial [Flavitalea sp.]|nr:S8 family serine peptidase [Flavitalea sp.]
MSTFLPRRLQRIAHILLCFLLLFFSGCLPPTQSSQSDRKATSFKKDQLVVRYNSKLSSRLRDSVRNVLFGKYKITKIERCVCDSTLELIYASGIEWHLDSTLKGNSTTGGVDSSMKGNTSTGGVDSTRGNSSRDGVSVVGGLDSVTGNRSRGGVDSMYRVIYSRNFLLDRVIPGSKRMEKNVPAEYGGQKSKKVRIAVIDTGLDTLSAFTEASYFKFLLPASQVAYQEVGISWVPTNATSRYFGWNFIQNNQNIMDDHSFQHGTNVTGLILGQNPDYAPEIIPLKAVNAQGNFEMFHVLCALRFAERAQVNLVNTSWGYFGAPNIAMTDVLQSLSSKGIAVIASAGNEGIEIGGVDSYYPACYSNDQSGLKNVI